MDTEQIKPQVDASEAAAAQRRKHYKSSLNLPKTTFGMKANLREREPQTLEGWQAEGMYARILERRADGPAFIFHDGPPYANGTIHTGHLLNKVLKDLVVRTRSMAGYACPFVPGWDCHGLPIEHRVLTELKEAGKLERLEALSDDNRRMAIRRECTAYARKYRDLQAKGMQRLLTNADYESPYLTMSPEFEESCLEVFAGLLDEGLIYRDKKPVHWSIANETALAEAELEYYDREDPSVYVHFEAAETAPVAAAFGLSEIAEPVSFLIWTTTPWTLPANLLIAVHSSFAYCLVRLDGRLTIVGKERLAAVAACRQIADAPVLGETVGANLVGLRYKHPFFEIGNGPEGLEPCHVEAAYRIVEAAYVTVDDGTGLVHTAPGHGADDHHTGLREGTPIYCPVRDDGCYDESVPAWLRGLSIWEANPRIEEALRLSGHLFHAHRFVHSYPHDWRSKTPVIFRATEQWFVAVDQPARTHGASLRDMGLQAARSEVQFVPTWGQNRLVGMLESRPDWCLSRQRAWGLPIPAFRLPDGSVFLTAASTRAIAKIFGRHGSDAWFQLEPADLLREWNPAHDPDAPQSLHDGTVSLPDLVKQYDIFDVWFESGSSWHAVMRRRGLGFPTNLYLEGSDQHRGWFQASLLAALGITGQAPFKTLLTHGFVVDKDGRKMSKSLGNTLEVDDLLRDFGADVCRWWVSSLPFENDIKVDRSYFEVAGESYRKVRNTMRFVLSNLHDFNLEEAVDLREVAAGSIDGWALAKAYDLRRVVTAAYESYDFRRAHLALFDFCNDTLSSVYLNATKDRLYCDQAQSPRRRRTQTVLHTIGELLCTLLAPILPHTAQEAFKALRGEPAEVHLETYSELPETALDERWERIFELRRTAAIRLEAAKSTGLENPLDAGLRLPTAADLEELLPDLADLFGVSRVSFGAGGNEPEVVDLRDQPRCERSWKRDATVAMRSDGGWLSERDAAAVGVN